MNDQELALLKRIHDDAAEGPDYEFSDEEEATLLSLIDEDFVAPDPINGMSLFLTHKGKIALGLAVPEGQERLL